MIRITAMETISIRAAHADVGADSYRRGARRAGRDVSIARPSCADSRTLAKVLMGEDAPRIELLWHHMFKAVHYAGYAGAEMRAISAIDIALWDLLGKITNRPDLRVAGRRMPGADSAPTTPASSRECLSRPRAVSRRSRPGWHASCWPGHSGDEDLAVRRSGASHLGPEHQPRGIGIWRFAIPRSVRRSETRSRSRWKGTADWNCPAQSASRRPSSHIGRCGSKS